MPNWLDKCPPFHREWEWKGAANGWVKRVICCCQLAMRVASPLPPFFLVKPFVVWRSPPTLTQDQKETEHLKGPVNSARETEIRRRSWGGSWKDAKGCKTLGVIWDAKLKPSQAERGERIIALTFAMDQAFAPLSWLLLLLFSEWVLGMPAHTHTGHTKDKAPETRHNHEGQCTHTHTEWTHTHTL